MNLTREQIEGWKMNNGAMSVNEFRALCDIALSTFSAELPLIGGATQDGPLGGFAPVGPAAVELDFMLTQYVLEIQTAADDATSVEDSVYHDAEAMKLRRQIIDRFASSATLSTSEYRRGLEDAAQLCEGKSGVWPLDMDGSRDSEWGRRYARCIRDLNPEPQSG